MIRIAVRDDDVRQPMDTRRPHGRLHHAPADVEAPPAGAAGIDEQRVAGREPHQRGLSLPDVDERDLEERRPAEAQVRREDDPRAARRRSPPAAALRCTRDHGRPRRPCRRHAPRPRTTRPMPRSSPPDTRCGRRHPRDRPRHHVNEPGALDEPPRGQMGQPAHGGRGGRHERRGTPPTPSRRPGRRSSAEWPRSSAAGPPPSPARTRGRSPGTAPVRPTRTRQTGRRAP